MSYRLKEPNVAYATGTLRRERKYSTRPLEMKPMFTVVIRVLYAVIFNNSIHRYDLS